MAKNSTALTEREQIDYLCDDLGDIVSVGRQEARKIANKLKWLVGEAIVTSPLYKKYSKGQGGLIKTIAAKMGYGEKNLYEWVHFYERFHDGKYDLDAPWSKIRAALPAPKDESENKPVEVCKKCPLHCK